MTLDASDFPQEMAGPYPRPPLRLTDAAGRKISVERHRDDPEALLAMYRQLDPADRAQGIPPPGDVRLRKWIEGLLAAGYHAAARHGARVVGHAALLPEPDGSCELVIFVLGEYQGAGIGTRLLSALLGLGAAEGVERVWLVVRRTNLAARRLYQKVGFVTCRKTRAEAVMALRLA